MATVGKSIGELVSQVLTLRDSLESNATEKKRIEADLSPLERELSDLMDDQGLQSVRAADGRLLYKSRDLFVSVPAAQRDAVVDACRVLGLEDLIRIEVPTTQLKSRIKEWMGDLGDKEQIPEQLRPLVNVHEEYSIRVRKS